MTDIYDELQTDASDVIAEFKQGVVTLTRTTPGTPDPETPYIPVAGTPTEYILDAVVKAVSTKFVGGTTILATDKEVTCGVLPIEPSPGDTMTIDGKGVTILKTIRTPAAGTVITWKFIVRG